MGRGRDVYVRERDGVRPQNLVLESDEDVAFDMCVKGKGRLVKRGAGTLTLAGRPH